MPGNMIYSNAMTHWLSRMRCTTAFIQDGAVRNAPSLSSRRASLLEASASWSTYHYRLTHFSRRGHGDLYAGRSKADVESERGPQNELGIKDNTEAPPTKVAKVDRNVSPVPNVFTVTKTPGSYWFEDLLLGCIGMKQ